jgi:hypothetical protein
MKFLAVVVSAALASGTGYDIDLGTSLQSGMLKVQPSITGPAGGVVTYDMKVRREGRGKSSDSSQSGNVKLGQDGHARLASNSVNVAPGDRYVVTVRVRDGTEVVAEKSAHYP